MGVALLVAILINIALCVADVADLVRSRLEGGGSSTVLDLQKLADHPRAVCTDGSPATYYIQTVNDSRQWNIHFEGGGWCYNNDSCSKRYPWLTSSKFVTTYQPTKSLKPGTILTTKGTSYSGGNLVWLNYCTSDGYVGNSSGKVDEEFYFRGADVVKALFTELHLKHGLKGKEQKVLVSGCSAGGRGVMHNLNRIVEYLSSFGVDTESNLHFLPDSAMYIDQRVLSTPWSLSNAVPTGFTGVPKLYGLYGDKAAEAKAVVQYTQAAVDPYCAKAFGEEEKWKCLVGGYVFPGKVLKGHFLANFFQNDAYAVFTQTGTNFPSDKHSTPVPPSFTGNATVRKYIAGFATKNKKIAAKFGESGFALEGVKAAAFSAACLHHCNTETSRFSTSMTIGGKSLAEALDEFVTASSSGGGYNKVTADTCVGLACGRGCAALDSVSWVG